MFRNHPRGLAVLFFTEMWERFGFYTLMAIYTLYMDERLGWSDGRKAHFYGLFLAAVYFLPVLGGWLGDRVLGPARTIRLGAVLLGIGYLGLAISSREWIAPFYGGLFLVALGTGLFKANVSVLVGNLYPEGSPLKDSGFNIFYMGVNLGAAIAPLAATFIHDQLGSYNLSFGAAAAGMVVAMVTFRRAGRLFPGPDAQAEASADPGHTAAPGPTAGSWSSDDRQRFVTLLLLFAIAVFFWIGFYQNGFALTLFAQRSAVAYRFLKPETYQFFGPFFILVLTPPLVWAFSKLRERRKEPTSASKITLGLAAAGLSMLVMVWAGLAGGNKDLNIMSPGWLVSSYLLVSLGEILVSPMGLSLVSKVAPSRIRGLMMGFWFSATATGSYSSGVLGRLYDDWPHHAYFLLIAAVLFFGALMALLLRRWLDRFGD